MNEQTREAKASDGESHHAPFADRRLEWDLPTPDEADNPEAHRARLLKDGAMMADFNADSLRRALWAAERIVRYAPDTVPAEARRTAARVLADVAHTATYQCERIALAEPELFGDVPRLVVEWPVLIGLHRKDNDDRIARIHKGLSIRKMGRKVPSLREDEANINWVLRNVASRGLLPYRGGFVRWPQHPENAWPKVSPVPLPPFTNQTFEVWWKHFRPFLRRTICTLETHPAFSSIGLRGIDFRDSIKHLRSTRAAVRWSDVRADVFKSLARLDLIQGAPPDSPE
ncbi:MAG: hypothetical protein FJ276_30920 [Planctomycetes bacterium]|nr:hypothetical protein [Planctomycetota bacterium]